MRKASDMPFHRGLKVKLYPSNEQKQIIAVNDGAYRAVYNHLVATGDEIWQLSKTASSVPAYRERINYLRSVREDTKAIKNALPYLYGNDVDSMVVDNAVKNYYAAWENMKVLHTGVPVKKKKSHEQSYQTNAHYYSSPTKAGHISNVRLEDAEHVVLPVLGRIRIGACKDTIRTIMGQKDRIRFSTITISRDAVGEYWASFALSPEEAFYSPLPKTGSRQGIDLNLLEFANGSDGSSAENMCFHKKALKKLAKQQHKLCRMKERAIKEGRNFWESKNYQEQRKRVATTHRKVQRQRDEYLHCLSKHEVENQDFIAAEDLKVSNLMKNHRLARAIADAGWRKFLTMLRYKRALYGKTVILVPPQYTSQTCSACGYVLKKDGKLTLSDREWECPQCHTHHHRDTNAASVILQRGVNLCWAYTIETVEIPTLAWQLARITARSLVGLHLSPTGDGRAFCIRVSLPCMAFIGCIRQAPDFGQE